MKLEEQHSIYLNSTSTSLKITIETPTKNYVDSSTENDRIKGDMPTLLKNQNIEFDNTNSTNLGSFRVNRNPTSDNELLKKYVDDSIGESSVLIFNQTLQKYKKVSVGNKN